MLNDSDVTAVESVEPEAEVKSHLHEDEYSEERVDLELEELKAAAHKAIEAAQRATEGVTLPSFEAQREAQMESTSTHFIQEPVEAVVEEKPLLSVSCTLLCFQGLYDFNTCCSVPGSIRFTSRNLARCNCHTAAYLALSETVRLSHRRGSGSPRHLGLLGSY